MKEPSDHPRFAVVGNPVSQSLSPRIHTLFGQSLNIELTYELAEIALEAFESCVASRFADGYAGLNITVPFKERALGMASTATPRALDAGAANTLMPDASRQIRADNTDGEGLIRDLIDRQRVSLAGARIMLIGAGGATRGILPALIEAGATRIQILNRTVERAEDLRARFSGRGTEISVEGLRPEAGRVKDIDGIIQCTAVGGDVVAPWTGLQPDPGTWYYDLRYGPAAQQFLAWAKRCGCALAVDGLGMLVEQAAAAFEIWHGVRPATDSVLSSLREQ